MQYTVDEVMKFIGKNECYVSVKLDGLSCTLLYEDGRFVSAATRGDGFTGSDVTNAALVIDGIPKVIPTRERLVVDGEVIIDYETFRKINELLPESKKFKNPRNLAAGTLTMLDNAIIKDRHLRFIAWRVIESSDDSDSNMVKLVRLTQYGFTFSPMFVFNPKDETKEDLEILLDKVKNVADVEGLPCDGAVIAVDSVSKAASLGETEKFPKHSIAYKYEDELAETTLREIEWSTSKTGLVNPVAIFDEVELCGSTVNRATLHNPDYIKAMQLGIGDKILVRKANQIIPRVHENLTRSDTYKLPTKCPCCDAPLDLVETGQSNMLYCINPNCGAKMLSKLVHFCSRDAIDIDGMSEATLQFLINRGWVKSFKGIYHLNDYKTEWMRYPGFGKKSVEKLLSSIEKSRKTTLDRFIYSLSIPLIGKTASKDIAKVCNGSFEEFMNTTPSMYVQKVEGFGAAMNAELTTYMKKNIESSAELSEEFDFVNSDKADSVGTELAGKTFVVTGDVYKYKNRKELQEDIEAHGGKVVGSVSAKTDYLINNDVNSGSSKNTKAKKLNIPIISEEEFIYMLRGEK